jgi:hypothetical protein
LMPARDALFTLLPNSMHFPNEKGTKVVNCLTTIARAGRA